MPIFMMPVFVMPTTLLTVALLQPPAALPPKAWHLMAATASNNNALEVRLLWLPGTAWLPEGGFNVYRIEGDKAPVKLNPAPLKATTLLKPETILQLKGNSGVTVPTIMHSSKFETSGATFTKMTQEVTALQKLPGLTPKALTSKLSEGVSTQERYKRLGTVNTVNTVAPPPKVAPTEGEKVAARRQQVILHALASRTIAKQLGIAFDDTTAQSGKVYTYILKTIDASGVESSNEVAAFQITAGLDATPPAPTVGAVQISQDLVDLHWDPPTNTQSRDFVFTTYDVWRGTDITKRNGDNPIVLSYQKAADGSNIQHLTSFRDKSVPLGNNTYTVVMTDAFGRQSPKATVNVTVNDLRVPEQVPSVVAVLSPDGKGTRIYYFPSPAESEGAGLTTQYTVTRRDSEVATSAPTLLQTPETTSETPSGLAGLGNREKTASAVNLDEMPVAVAGQLLGDRVFWATFTEKQAKSFANKTLGDLKKVGKLPEGLTQALKNVRMATDTKPPVDHYFIYGVQAEYTINHRPTKPTETTSLGIPDLAPLATPTNPTAAFTKADVDFGNYDFTTNKPRWEAKNIPTMSVPQHLVKPTIASTTATSTTNKPIGRAAQIGGSVMLTWPAVGADRHVRYRVYRVSATGLFAPINTNPQSRLIQKSPYGRYRGGVPVFFADYPAAEFFPFTLLAETETPQFTDTLPRSQGVNYLYKIQAVTRWGVESQISTITKLYCPATVSPSVPSVQYVHTNAQGRIEIKLRPCPVAEQVTEYRVFRKISQVDPIQTPTVNVPLATTVASNGQVPVSTLQRGQFNATVGGQRLTPIQAKGSSSVRLGLKKYTSPAALMGRGITAKNGNIQNVRANAPKLSDAALKNFVDWRLTTELKPGTDVQMVSAPDNSAITVTDLTAKPGTEYLYWIIAINTDKIASAPSQPLDGKPIKALANPPTGLSAAMNNKGQVTLTWTAPEGGAGSYLIERAIAQSETDSEANLAFLPLSTLDSQYGAPQTIWRDDNARVGRLYRYHVTATDSQGMVSDAVVVNMRVPAPGAIGLAPAAILATAPTINPNTNPVGAGGKPAPLTGVSAHVPSKTARFDTAYFLVSNTTDNAFSVKVEKAEYSIAGFAIDADNFYYCHPAERFLKLRLRIKNTTNQPQNFGYETLTASALSEGIEQTPTKNWKLLSSNRIANQSVAARDEIEIEGVLIVAAESEPTALTLSENTFDLTDPVNAIAPLSVKPEQPASLNAPLSLARIEATVLTAEKKGNEFTVTVQVRNATLAPLTLDANSISVQPFDTDGDKYAGKVNLEVKTTLEPGASKTLQIKYTVPPSLNMEKLKIYEKDSRVYVISLKK